jgi:hypothetical protein
MLFSSNRDLIALIATNYSVDSAEKYIFTVRKVMFTDGKHKFTVQEHMFTDGKHKFTVQEHKIDSA